MIYVILALVLLLLLWVLALRCQRRELGFFGLSAYHFAHRGLHASSQGIPENSLKAFQHAVDAGYGAELDVHLSKDGRLVVMHDENLLRMAKTDKNICDCTAAELESLRLEDTDEPIPYLEEVLPLFAGKTPLMIELKTCGNNYIALTRRVCNLLKRYPKLQFCIESFDPRTLLWLRKKHPEIVRGQLSCNLLKDRGRSTLPEALILRGLLMNFLTVPHFVSYRFEERNRPGMLLCRLLWGVQEASWTIRDDEALEKALNHGALIIFEHCRPELRN